MLTLGKAKICVPMGNTCGVSQTCLHLRTFSVDFRPAKQIWWGKFELNCGFNLDVLKEHWCSFKWKIIHYFIFFYLNKHINHWYMQWITISKYLVYFGWMTGLSYNKTMYESWNLKISSLKPSTKFYLYKYEHY